MNFTGDHETVGLASLINPLGVDEFLQRFWSTRHMVNCRSVDWISGFAKQMSGLSVRELLRVAEDPVIVMHTTSDRHYRGSRVLSADAFHFYESGMALYFNLASSFSDVKVWTDRLSDDVGHSRGRCKASAFITPQGWMTELHFDPNENFTLQLRGRKRWQIADNLDVTFPVDRFTHSGELPERMASYYSGPAPRPTAPTYLEEVTPGTMLYVPRGKWHSVESIDDSVSLNFCIIPETWSSYLIPVVERLFLTSPELRETATGVAGNKDLRQNARATLNKKLAIALKLMHSLRADLVIPEAPSSTTSLRPEPGELLRRNRLAATYLASITGGSAQLKVTLGGFAEPSPTFGAFGMSRTTTISSKIKSTVQISPIQVQILSWILQRDDFALLDVASCFASVSEEAITDFLVVLLRIGVIYR